MTPDALPFVGPTELAGLWLCCGWSGTGFKTGLSVSAATSRDLTTAATLNDEPRRDPLI